MLRTPTLERAYTRVCFGDPGRALASDEIARVVRACGEPEARERGARLVGRSSRLVRAAAIPGVTPTADSGVVELREGEAWARARWIREGGAAYLHDVEVEARVRGRGLGRKLVDRASTELGELWVVPEEGARGFYQRLGFREVGWLETWVAR